MDIRWHESWLERERHRQPSQVAEISGSISGIVFDFSGILYDNSAWRRWFLNLLGKLGIQTHYELFYRVWEREYVPQITAGTGYWDAMADYLRAIGMKRGRANEAIVAGRTRRQQYSREIRPLPQVRKTLCQLAVMQIPVALVCTCHWDDQQVQKRLTTMGLSSYFPEVRCLAGKVAQESDAVIAAALELLGTDPSTSAFIGRTSESLRAAKSAGIVGVAFNYTGECRADVYLEHFEELLKLPLQATRRRLAG